jgi:hypothetical protein
MARLKMFSTFWLWIKKYIFFGWVKALRSERQKAKVLAATLAVCRGHIENGKKVNAIKLYRECTGVGLKESKAEIDKLSDEIQAEQDAEQEEYDEIEAICEDDLLPGESGLDNDFQAHAALETITDTLKDQVEEAQCQQEDRGTGIA